MEALIDRVIKIMGFMYVHPQAELVIHISQERNYLAVGWANQFDLDDEAVECLVRNEIIEFDSGCDEEDHETRVYVLTTDARKKIKSILKNKKTLLLKT